MNSKTRKYLFLFFILAFVTITPLVSLYAAGYKFSFSGDFLQKTGMLIIDSTPSGAKIIINDEPQQKFLNKLRSKALNSTKDQNILTTPAKIKGLIPDEYTVELEKDGYWSWEKKLEINPGSSTFAEDIVMFKNNLPQPVTSSIIINSKQSLNKKYIAYTTENTYQIFNDDNEEVINYQKNASSTNQLTNSIIWLDNNHILFDYFLFSLDDWNKPKDLSSSLVNINLESVTFSNSSLVYIQNNNSLIKLDSKSVGIETVLNSEKIFDYLIKDNLIYTIEELNKNIYLIVYDDKKIIRQINLNFDDSYVFVNTNNSLINIYSSRFKTLNLVDPLDYFGPLKETINNVGDSFWVDNEKLVYYNDFEIWIYEKDNFKKTILTRISDKINYVLWHPSNNYIIYSTAESLFTIELDNREKHSTNHLIKLNNIDFLDINNDGDVLYFYSELGNQRGLFKLAI
ncbi:MAG: hypothetical protein PF572_02835 [Patescibacteria group bacterium]|jgi:hypothetical protein|nr:hypothetical protein [Patescibacteria group bacterium]